MRFFKLVKNIVRQIRIMIRFFFTSEKIRIGFFPPWRSCEAIESECLKRSLPSQNHGSEKDPAAAYKLYAGEETTNRYERKRGSILHQNKNLPNLGSKSRPLAKTNLTHY